MEKIYELRPGESKVYQFRTNPVLELGNERAEAAFWKEFRKMRYCTPPVRDMEVTTMGWNFFVKEFLIKDRITYRFIDYDHGLVHEKMDIRFSKGFILDDCFQGMSVDVRDKEDGFLSGKCFYVRYVFAPARYWEDWDNYVIVVGKLYRSEEVAEIREKEIRHHFAKKMFYAAELPVEDCEEYLSNIRVFQQPPIRREYGKGA